MLSVRDADAARFRTLADLRGSRVGTLGGTIAYEILPARRARARHPCGLVRRRRASVSAIWCSAASTPCCSTTCSPSGAAATLPASRSSRRPSPSATTSACCRRRNAPLRDSIDEILRGAMRDGTLERIFRKWDVWNDDQPTLYRARAGRRAGRAGHRARRDRASVARRCRGGKRRDAIFPSLLRAAVVTHRAVVPGDGAGGRARRADRDAGACTAAGPSRAALTGYVELMRGTPILLQLFVLYYGLAAAIRLPAFVAALLGLALNYAAYESEIYRAALEAVPGRPARGGAHARPHRAAGADARARAAGVSARAGADDERLRGAAQGLVARVGAHRHGADQADADLRDQPRQLGDSRDALRGAVSRDVAAAGRARPPARARWRTPTA